MSEIMRPILEIAVIIPGMLLAYFRCFWESACQEVLSVIIFRL